MIEALIDKQDNFEIIRDQLAGIIVSEISSQIELAKLAGKDWKLWDLNVYLERSNPWDKFRRDSTPIVNIWCDNASFIEGQSNVSDRQKVEWVYNIDCLGYGLSHDDPYAGHYPGDQAAAFAAHRAVRLVRNILMSAHYRYLGLQGLVWQRWPLNITVFQPPSTERNVHNVVGARLPLRVQFNETSPQYEAENTLEYIAIDIEKYSDGLVTLKADYDFS